jgi:hypothetical protein
MNRPSAISAVRGGTAARTGPVVDVAEGVLDPKDDGSRRYPRRLRVMERCTDHQRRSEMTPI